MYLGYRLAFVGAQSPLPSIYYPRGAYLGQDASRERLVLNAVLKHSTTRSELLRVMDLINLSTIGSPATIHGAIKRLEVGHYLKLAAITGDQRIKAVSLTSKSLALFKRLDRLVLNTITSK